MRLFLWTGMLLILLCNCTQAQEYVAGKIITTQKDTVVVKLLKFKSRKQEAQESFLSVQVQEADGIVKTLYPVDIDGYSKEGEVFRSLRPVTGNYPQTGIFIKQITSGRAELYYHPGFPTGGGKYFFRRNTEREFTVWDGAIVSKVEELGDQRRSSGRNNDPNAIGGLQFRITQNTDVFREYFTRYFADCPLVVNKLKVNFYSDGDIKSIFRDYNAEGEQIGKTLSSPK